MLCQPNASSSITSNLVYNNGIPNWEQQIDTHLILAQRNVIRTNAVNTWEFIINNYASTTFPKSFSLCGGHDSGGGKAPVGNFGYINTNSAITSLVFSNSGGNFSAGTVLIYGVK
jgi:hypothetical protein